MKHLNLFSKVLLAGLFLLIVWRFVAFAFHVGNNGLQMDYSALYHAGRSVNKGYSPYVNNIQANPVIWDGIAYYKHSRFLYPPLAANFFQIYAIFPYSFAKFLWIFTNLLGIFLSLYLSLKMLKIKTGLQIWLFLGIVTLVYHPLFVLLERGQVDGLVILLLVSGIYFLVMKPEKLGWIGGVFLVFAALFKLYLGFLFIFLLLRRKWSAAIGYIGGGILILLLTTLLNGKESIPDYLGEHLPRISEYGEKGPDEARLTQEEYSKLFQGVQERGTTRIQRKTYTQGLFAFTSVASGFTVTARLLKGLGIQLDSNLKISLVTYLLLLGIVYLIQRKLGRIDGPADMVYWLIAILIVLFGSPLAWAMSMVWLLPIIVIPIYYMDKLYSKQLSVSLGLILIAFFLILAIMASELMKLY